jgi:thioredoxin-related protein
MIRFKNTLVIAIFLTIGTVVSFAQNSEKVYTAHAEGWLVDVNEAQAISKATGKPIMANFTGSDWCGWCIKLKREVFDKPEFKTWAEENVVLLELDFPRRTKLPEEFQKQNASLQQAFQVRGFPTLWVFNLIENKKDDPKQFTIAALGSTGYVSGGPAKFNKHVETILAEAQ